MNNNTLSNIIKEEDNESCDGDSNFNNDYIDQNLSALNCNDEKNTYVNTYELEGRVASGTACTYE